MSDRRLRCLFVCSTYPTPDRPTEGLVNELHATALSQHCDIRVLQPRPTVLHPFSFNRSVTRTSSSSNNVPVTSTHAYYVPFNRGRVNGSLYGLSIRAVLNSICEEFKPDFLLTSFGYPDAVGVCEEAKRLGLPAVAILRGTDVHTYSQMPRRWPAIRAALNSALLVVPICKFLAEEALRHGVDANRMEVIHYGVDHKFFRPMARDAGANKLGLPLDRRRILFVGNLIPVKNVPLLIEAFAQLIANNHPNLDLCLIGTGYEEKMIRRLLRDKQLEDRVQLPGSKSPQEILNWIAASDLVAMSSRNEGLPHVILEALSCGRPVVAPDVGGISEVIRHEVNGVLVKPQSASALRDGLEASLAKSWNADALRHSVAHFDWDGCAQLFLATVRAKLTYSQDSVRAALLRQPAGARRLRGIFVCSTFPCPTDLNEGLINLTQLNGLASYVDFEVLRPQMHLPFHSRGFFSNSGTRFTAEGIPVFDTQCNYLPLERGAINGRLYAHSIRNLLKDACERFTPDFLLTSFAFPDNVGVVHEARILGLPVISIIRGTDIHSYCQMPRRWKSILLALQYSSVVIARSHSLARKVIEGGIPEEKVHVVYNGVDTTRFRIQDRTESTKRLDLAEGRKRVVFVGNLVPIKSVPTLVDAFEKMVRDGNKDTDLYLIGDGPERSKIHRLIASRNLEQRVIAIGERPHAEIADWMSACDVFCLPSLNEGLPNVILEALACGRPVVASCVGGIPEVVRQGETGALIQPGDTPALTEALLTALAKHWEPAVIREAVKNFNWDANARCLTRLIEAAVVERSRISKEKSRFSELV